MTGRTILVVCGVADGWTGGSGLPPVTCERHAGRMTRTNGMRVDLREAAGAFVELVATVPGGGWQLPALGVWTVLDLVGHTSRALTTIETYLKTPAERPVLSDTVAYFRAASTAAAGDERAAAAVAERGRQAGRALGARPEEAVAALAVRVLAAVDAAPDDAVLAVPLGAMLLRDYLPTRTFELIVHSLDLAAALGSTPSLPSGPVRAAAHLATDLALASGRGPDLLFALTGRRPWPADSSVL